MGVNHNKKKMGAFFLDLQCFNVAKIFFKDMYRYVHGNHKGVQEEQELKMVSKICIQFL